MDFIKGINDNEKTTFSYNSVKFLPKRLSKINFEQSSFPIITKSSSPRITSNPQINIDENEDIDTYILKK